jgi:hypothetical protein
VRKHRKEVALAQIASSQCIHSLGDIFDREQNKFTAGLLSYDALRVQHHHLLADRRKLVGYLEVTHRAILAH